MTALHYACKYGHHDIVRHLIDHGADINIEDFVSYLSTMDTMQIIYLVLSHTKLGQFPRK